MDNFLRYIGSPRDHGVDYRVEKLPLMATSAWTMAALAAFYFAFLFFLVPNWFKSHKKFLDLRPVLLIFYGLQFGIHGVGTALFFMTMDLSSSWSCQRVNQSATDIRTMGLIYSAYLLFLVKVAGLLEPVLQTLHSHFPLKSEERNLTGSTLRLTMYVFLVRASLKANPGHSFLWIAVTDMAVESFYYGYQALTSASPEMLPDPKWKRAISLLRVAQAASLMLHGLHLSSQAGCFMPKPVAFVECVYALLVITLETLDYVQSSVRKARSERERQ